MLERIAVHAVPVGVGGEAEGAVGNLAIAAITEKTAGVAGNLVASDGDVLENALLHGVVVGIEGSDGELRQHVIFSVRQGEDVEGGHAIGNGADFSLLRIDAAVAVLRAKTSLRKNCKKDIKMCLFSAFSFKMFCHSK